MDLHIPPDGPRIRISQPLGSAVKECRLDRGVIEAIASVVEVGMRGVDLLIVNKSGKREAQGSGLCSAISMAMAMAMAMGMGIPTRLGVNGMNSPDFLSFADGLAQPVPPELGALRGWYGSTGTPNAVAPA